MPGRYPFGLPSGWYVVAASDEVRPGQIVARRYFERDLVVYRTARGALGVVDAYCPHLGAHLGKLGTVVGETLQCGFHGFRFESGGRCVATGYDGPPPVAARLRCWEFREKNGLVLVWFDPQDRKPTWEVPDLDCTDWSTIRWKRYAIATHPQETTENSVDFGHFTRLHGFVDGEMTEDLATDGPTLTSGYAANRPYRIPGFTTLKIRVEYDVKVAGLGYSQVDIRLPALRWKLRAWVLPVPVDGEHIDLVLGMSAHADLGPLRPLVSRIAHHIVCREVEQDLDAWEHKIYLDKPLLARGDGPIAAYRSWARQFYV